MRACELALQASCVHHGEKPELEGYKTPKQHSQNRTITLVLVKQVIFLKFVGG